MPSEVLVKPANDTGAGKQIRFCISGSFSPVSAKTNWTIGTPTNVAITLSALAAAAGRQSAKVDLGATRAERYEVLGCIDPTSAPAAGGRIDYYWMPSTSATAAQGNVAGQDGSDAAAGTGGSPIGVTTLAQLIAMSQYIGSLACNITNAVQNGVVGIFSPGSRWGQLIVVNNLSVAFSTTGAGNGDNECHQVFNPIVDEIQNAV